MTEGPAFEDGLPIGAPENHYWDGTRGPGKAAAFHQALLREFGYSVFCSASGYLDDGASMEMRFDALGDELTGDTHQVIDGAASSSPDRVMP